ncbi:glutaminyl-peptide cyclotransferase [Vaginisenegalia massiliensis]|uniref:glutaminyl-peptide cyclotransferase n=1 Tax=Vaginisenegalia massiliensis TaxID=2058294 RepID=UPI000F51B5A2|nr:glutaminyl-peptide cyclotransferase [Vaginisenegalia massiliensis]
MKIRAFAISLTCGLILSHLMFPQLLVFGQIPADYQGQVILEDTYPADQTLFTQGFELNQEGQLIQATGQKGHSVIGIMDLAKGQFIEKDRLGNQFFGEGITITPNNIWQLTYKEGKAFKRDLTTFKVVDQVSYQGEGWGLAYDQDRDCLWMSDGSETLQIRDPQTFQKMGQLIVTFQGKALPKVNEMEYVNGYLYANVWTTKQIVKINLQNGQVEKVYDIRSIVDQANIKPEARKKMDVLNGIAHLKDDQFYLTGKWYPYIFKVCLLDN